MILVAKTLIALFLFALLAWIMVGWFETFLEGKYWQTAPIHLTILFGICWPVFWLFTLAPLILKTITFKPENDQ